MCSFLQGFECAWIQNIFHDIVRRNKLLYDEDGSMEHDCNVITIYLPTYILPVLFSRDINKYWPCIQISAIIISRRSISNTVTHVCMSTYVEGQNFICPASVFNNFIWNKGLHWTESVVPVLNCTGASMQITATTARMLCVLCLFGPLFTNLRVTLRSRPVSQKGHYITVVCISPCSSNCSHTHSLTSRTYHHPVYTTWLCFQHTHGNSISYIQQQL